MAGEDDHLAAGCHRPVDVLQPMRLDSPTRLEHADLSQMRVFGGDPAEIVPHVIYDTCDLAIGELGKGAAKVQPGAFGNPEKGADMARQCAAEGRSPVERQ
jgi:hypothetical protein